MSRIAVLVLVASAFLSAGASRHPFDIYNSDTAGISSSQQSLLHMMREVQRHKESERAARIVVRFIVPPGVGSKFEDAWLDLEENVIKCERGVRVFDLKKHSLDNLIYISYGEWKDMRGVHDYFTARHFKKFVDYIEDHGVKFQVEFLKSLSSDLDQEEHGMIVGHWRKEHQGQGDQDWDKYKPKDGSQGGQGGQGAQGQGGDDWDKYVPDGGYIPDDYRPGGGEHKRHKKEKRHGRRGELSESALANLPKNGLDADEALVFQLWKEVHRTRNMHHVLISYIVPPGEGEGFTDAWLDAAEDTSKEKHNRMYSLAKVATDNTRFYAYGTWDSMQDYIDHFESKHIGKLIDYTADKDIIWFITPLTKIGRQPE